MSAADITIHRGTNRPDIVWRLLDEAGQPFQGQGSEFLLTIRSGNERLEYSTAVAGSGLTFEPSTGDLRWRRSIGDSLKIGKGKVGRYEIERRLGEGQSYLISGSVSGKGSISDD